MKRRIISVLLALVLALSLVPTTALASQPDAEPEQPQIQADGAQQNGDTPQPAPAADGEESVQPEEQDTPDQPEGEENAPAAPEAETTDAPAQPADDDQAPQIAEPQPLLPADDGQDMPSVRIGSSADAHRHCVCGASHETVGDHTAEDFGAEAWTGVEYLSDIKTSGYYYLIKNITLSSGSSYGNFQWSLPTGINVVLCLNGHSISRDGASEKDSMIAVPRGSTLTITDCQDNGKITCAANKTGILVTGGGTLNLYGGKITGNKCGVKISAGGTFNLYGGSISDNTANSGAAVRIGSPASFTMSGGTIANNTGSYGGVYLTGTDSAFTMSGGSITGNKAEGNEDCRGGGVYNGRYDQTDGVFEVSGKVTITGNTYIAHYYLKKDEGPSNVFLAFTDKPIVIGKDGLNSASRIGIAQPNSGVTTIVAVKGVKDTATANCFTSDSSTYGKYYITPQNEIWLSTSAPHTHNWSYTTSGAVITARCDADNCPSPKGGSVTITPPTDPTYNGQAKAATVTGSFTNGTPKPTVITYWKNGETLSGAPINAGEYTASITVNDAVATLTYTIAKAAPQAADFTFTAPTGLTYNGQRHEASVTVNTNVDGMGQITQIHYYNASGEEVEPINAGVYLVKIDVAEGKNYTAQLTPADSSWCMQIQPDPSTPVVTLNGDMTYTGSQIKPAVTVTLNGRTLTETTDYTVTYGANINAGENAGTVTVTKTAAQSDNYTFTSVQQQFTIAPKEVTVSGITAADKIYDGNTAATLNYDGVTFTGKVEEDTLTVSASGAFADKNVGQHKAVTLTGLTLSGASANNYCLAASQQTTATAFITVKEVTITGVTAVERSYQAGKLDVTVSGGVVNGKIGNDDVSADPANASGVMADADAGEAKPVTVKGYVLTGADAANYTLKEQPQNVTVTITQATQTITATGRTVIKNGVPVDITHWASALGAVTYWLENAPAGVTLSGNMLTVSPKTTASTFSMKVIAAATANYAAAETTITVTSKSDAGVSITVTSKSDAGVSITGIPAAITYGETLTLTAARTCPDDTNGQWTWTSSDPTVLAVSANGSAATVTAKKAAATGAVITVTYSGDNYDGAFTTAAITVAPRPVTVTGVTAQSRVYNGDAAVTLTGGTVAGKVGNDDVTVDLTGASGAMADANAGVNKPVAVTGVSLSGADRGNYVLSAQPTGVTATITPRPLTGASITLGGEDPVYNGQPQTRPVSAVTLDGLTLTPDTDYTVSYRDNTAAGTATVIITGTGNYTETAEQADVTSARTFDPGVTLYMALTLLSAAGTALLTGKRKEH